MSIRLQVGKLVIKGFLLKRNSKNSMFRPNEYVKKYFILSINEGTIRYANSEEELKKNPNAGTSYSYVEIEKIQTDYSDNGKTIDFSGDRNYPFPFGI